MIDAIRRIATVPEKCEYLLWPLIKLVPKIQPRVDNVADIYRNSSFKYQERNKRGMSEKI